MKVKELIRELLECSMDSEVIIELRNKPTSDMTYISDGAYSVTDNVDEVIISSED